MTITNTPFSDDEPTTSDATSDDDLAEYSLEYIDRIRLSGSLTPVPRRLARHLERIHGGIWLLRVPRFAFEGMRQAMRQVSDESLAVSLSSLTLIIRPIHPAVGERRLR